MDYKEIELMAEERRKWLDVVDKADMVANRLEFASMATSTDMDYNDQAVAGLCSIILEGVICIRDMIAFITSYHKGVDAASSITIKQAKALADAANMSLDKFYDLLAEHDAMRA